MKKSLLVFLAVFICLGINACSENSDLVEVEVPTSVSAFRNFPEVPVKVDTALNLQILFQTENGCGRYSRVDTATVGKTFRLQYFVKYPVEGSDVVCSEVSKPLVFTKPFRPGEAGTYRFRIWKTGEEYEEKTIEVVE
ncbi:hotdog family protein [Rufibacter roseus]|uniref:DUF4625 domain-containing protein n=1 Tax=Rufibacter roseus TaxID=1567108 RepID=A0ABW2DSV7_9BACT|nr:hypothetical protein [Rufibacter roseus]